MSNDRSRTEDGNGSGSEHTPSPEDLDRSSLRGDASLGYALELVRVLRAHCPWDARQTPDSLVPHLLEESAEVAETIRAERWPDLSGELGDLLLNLAFQIVLGEEAGHLTADAVVDRLDEKMRRRHPHVFGDGERISWEEMKARERAAAGEGARPRYPEGEDRESGASEDRPTRETVSSALDGLPVALGPLLRAYRLQEKASGVGFDWDEPSGALAKVREEVEEVAAALEDGPSEALGEELGDLFFALVNLARLLEVHAHPALEAANRKFERRFREVERRAREKEMPMPGSSLEALDALWDEVKRDEGTGPEEG